MRQHPAPGHDPLETMTQESYKHSIAPPPELVQEWGEEAARRQCTGSETDQHIAVEAAQWGADQELEACCAWLVKQGWFSADEHEAIEELRAARRPKPPSLKEQAMLGLSRIESSGEYFSDGMKDLATIRRALEQLPDNE